MFGLFNRKKKSREIQDWEIKLLINVINKLPGEYSTLKKQLEVGLFTSAGVSSFYPDLIEFTYDPELINDFENKGERDYELTNITVFDSYQKKPLNYSINVFSGVISGFSLKVSDKSIIDIDSVDVSSFTKLFYDNADYDKLRKILNATEAIFINPGDVYEVHLKGNTYYHIKDLEDGDFIGMDTHKVIYKITHDPIEIVVLNERLEELFNS